MMILIKARFKFLFLVKQQQRDNLRLHIAMEEH